MVDLAALDAVIRETTAALAKGREQIFAIAEHARSERDRLRQELEEVQAQITSTIQEVDALEVEERAARRRLMEVSRQFDRYGEKDMQEAYEKARELQIRLGLLRERENQLRQRRDRAEVALKRAEDTVQRAEKLVSQVGVAMSYLTDNLHDLSGQLGEMQQRQALGLRIMRAQEEERRRVAREIHDGPAQSMANVVLRAEVCEKLLGSDPARARQELQELREMVKASLQDVRQIIFDLRPMVLDDLGLVPALRRYLSEFEVRFGLPVELVVLGEERRLPQHLEVAVFRVIQEALNNVRQHAAARRASVKLELAEQCVNVLVSDNGRGFDVEEVLSGQRPDSYGLLGMRERVEMLEGKFRVTSQRGKGTQVRVQIPYRE